MGHCEEAPARGIGAWSAMGQCHPNAHGSRTPQGRPPTARACGTVGQSPTDVGHHGAVPLMARGHGALWGCTSPLPMDMGYCRAVPLVTPLWGPVVVSPMALGHGALWRCPPWLLDMGHCGGVPHGSWPWGAVGQRHPIIQRYGTPCSSATQGTRLRDTTGQCHPMHMVVGHMGHFYPSQIWVQDTGQQYQHTVHRFSAPWGTATL